MAQPQTTSPMTPEQIQCKPQPGDLDFDVSRTFLVLTATLILPMYLALSVVSYSLGAIY